MKKSLQFLLLFTSLLTTACSTTSAELRADPGESGSFQVELPYKTVLDNFSICVNQTATGRVSNLPLDTSYFYPIVKENPDETSASIDIVQASTFIFPKRVLTSIDIVADGKNTKITYYKHSMFDVFSDQRSKLEKWAKGTTECNQRG